jgi:hypothetical protein
VRIGEAHRAQLRVGPDGALVVADVRGDQAAPVRASSPTWSRCAWSTSMQPLLARGNPAPMSSKSREPGSYGERSCLLEDLAGHRWELTQTLRDVEPEEWGGTTVARW